MTKIGLMTIVIAAMLGVCTRQPQLLLSKDLAPEPALCQTIRADSNVIYRTQTFIRLPISPAKLSSNEVALAVEVQSVVNPDKEPLTFTVHIELQAETIPVGEFSLFPPSEPGIFSFRINEARDKIKKASQACVVIKLSPAAGQVVSDKVRVVFNKPLWR